VGKIQYQENSEGSFSRLTVYEIQTFLSEVWNDLDKQGSDHMTMFTLLRSAWLLLSTTIM
jgi:hypothetical protein